MNIATAISLYAGGPGSGRHPWGHKLNLGESTEDRYRDKQTKLWNSARSDLHSRIIERMIGGKIPPEDRPPIAHILGGGTASGKTTMSRAILGNDPNTLRVDPDELKTKIPEYEQLKEDDPDHAALRVHEESSYLTKSLMAEAIGRGLDLTYDATTSGTPQRTMGMVRTLMDHGYNVHVMFADVPFDVAKQRADLRAKESTDPMNRGRFVPDSVIADSHQKAAKNFFMLKDTPGISSVRLYDNSGKPNEPKLVFSKQGDGEGTVHDQKQFDRYHKKAFEDYKASAIQGHGFRPISRSWRPR